MISALKRGVATQVLGVLGGMGPRATANFLRVLTNEFNKAGIIEDSDFPRVIMLSLPLKDWDVTGATNKESVTYQIHAGIEWLRQAKADHIVIPCNSVHEFVGDFRVLNIIDATLKLCPPGKIGVLCSKQTREAKLYEKFSREIVYYPNQNSIDDIISSILSGIPCDLSLMMNGSFPECDSIVIGCTDLSLCSWRRTNKYVVDSTQALAEATVREMVARVASA